MNTTYENQYYSILQRIMEKEDSIELNKRTSTGTIRIPGGIIQVDLEKEFPILCSKKVFWKSALNEILWIMQKQSNDIHDLNSHIWDKWADEDGKIGKAYGYQVANPVTINEKTYQSQVHYVLETLREDPSSRRAIINLWNVNDLDEMNLTPCAFNTIWSITDGKLNCVLTQRSADFLVGVPFNTTQYALLTCLFARHLGVKPGLLTHVMADCHIYDLPSHHEGAKKMIANYTMLSRLQIDDDYFYEIRDTDNGKALINAAISHPTLRIDGEETDFFKINEKDIHIDNYDSLNIIKLDVVE